MHGLLHLTKCVCAFFVYFSATLTNVHDVDVPAPDMGVLVPLLVGQSRCGGWPSGTGRRRAGLQSRQPCLRWKSSLPRRSSGGLTPSVQSAVAVRATSASSRLGPGRLPLPVQGEGAREVTYNYDGLKALSSASLRLSEPPLASGLVLYQSGQGAALLRGIWDYAHGNSS